MKNKRILVLGIALVLFALVSGTVFAESLRDGWYTINFFGGARGPELHGFRIEEIRINGSRLEFYAPNRDRPVLATTGRRGGNAIHFQHTSGSNDYITIIDGTSFNWKGVRFNFSH